MEDIKMKIKEREIKRANYLKNTEPKVRYFSLIHRVFDEHLVYEDGNFRIKDKEGMNQQAIKVLCDLLDELGFDMIVDFYYYITKVVELYE